MDMKGFAKILKRYKYVVHLLIGLLGFITIVVASSIPDLNSSYPNIYNVAMGIGCSIVSTEIITIFILVLLSEEETVHKELNEWGIEKIFDERSNIRINENNFPKQKLDFIAFGLKHFRDANSSKNHIINLLKKGLHIQILTLSYEDGLEDGRTERRFSELCSLVDDNILTVEQAAKRIGLKRKEFLKKKMEI